MLGPASPGPRDTRTRQSWLAEGILRGYLKDLELAIVSDLDCKRPVLGLEQPIQGIRMPIGWLA